ncbi:ankyrin repeat-containing domain protein [Aspergillus insuetus]
MPNNKKETDLWRAVAAGNDCRWEDNNPDGSEVTPLIQALNAVDLRGDTALEIAAHENDVESPKLLLLENGLEINPPGHKPLLLRATFYKAIEAILAHGGVDVDQVDDLGRSALSNAVVRDDRESALVLLRYGARPDLSDTSGFSPLARAATNMHVDMAELLESAIGII